MQAQILELLSVLAMGKRLKEPIKVPRPLWLGGGPEQAKVVVDRAPARAKAYTPKPDPAASRPATPRVAGQRPRRTGPDPAYGRALRLMSATAHQRRPE